MVYVTQLDIIFSPNILIKSMLIKSLMSCNRRELYIRSLYMPHFREEGWWGKKLFTQGENATAYFLKTSKKAWEFVLWKLWWVQRSNRIILVEKKKYNERYRQIIERRTLNEQWENKKHKHKQLQIQTEILIYDFWF